MTTIVAHFFSAVDVPLVAPGNVPTIRIRRTDTQVLVITDSAMTEQGDGGYSFDFVPVDGLEYSIRADGDPTASGQTFAGGRYAIGSLSGTETARLETDIPAILVDTTAILADLVTAAALQARLLAFAAQDNVMLDGGPNAVSALVPDYDSAGLMLQGRIRAFDSAVNRAAATPGNVATETGELFRQLITATATTPGQADSYTSDRAL